MSGISFCRIVLPTQLFIMFKIIILTILDSEIMTDVDFYEHNCKNEPNEENGGK